MDFKIYPGILRLLIIQSTPLCNLDCDYCYLPDKSKHHPISGNVLEHLMRNLVNSNILGEYLSIVWHVGEPMLMKPIFYEEAFSKLENFKPQKCQIIHSFQTNGTLISEDYCKFINNHNVVLGISIDGPQFIHDYHRKYKNGKGSFLKIMNGIEMLISYDISFAVICVITNYSLDYPDEIFKFFSDLGCTKIGFNVEEIESKNFTSSLNILDIDQKYKKFMSRIYSLNKQSKKPLIIREFEQMEGGILHHNWDTTYNSQTYPLANISVDWQGNYSTFSPELVSAAEAQDKFIFGNVKNQLFSEIYKNEKFQEVYTSIYEGVDKCQKTCDYFSICRGGAPANKYFENGSFASTETLYCRLNRQKIADVVLENLEKEVYSSSNCLAESAITIRENPPS